MFPGVEAPAVGTRPWPWQAGQLEGGQTGCGTLQFSQPETICPLPSWFRIALLCGQLLVLVGERTGPLPVCLVVTVCGMAATCLLPPVLLPPGPGSKRFWFSILMPLPAPGDSPRSLSMRTGYSFFLSFSCSCPLILGDRLIYQVDACPVPLILFPDPLSDLQLTLQSAFHSSPSWICFCLLSQFPIPLTYYPIPTYQEALS